MKRAVLVVFPNERYLETCYCNFIPLSPPDTEYFSSKFTANCRLLLSFCLLSKMLFKQVLFARSAVFFLTCFYIA